MPGNTSSFLTLAGSDHDLRMRLGWLGPRSRCGTPEGVELTEQAPAFPQLQPERPSASVRATRFVTPEGVCANESLPPRAEGAARPF